MMIVDYVVADDCSNSEAMVTCLKCGKCGRKFNDYGILIKKKKHRKDAE